MLTANKETTRTDRNGCLERTLDATSCTQMLSDIRCAILTNSVQNSSMPEGSTSRALPSDFSLLASLSEPERARMMYTYCLRKAQMVEGSAASSTETASTIAMSSSSVRCASLAASSSSCAIPSETEKARSEPSEPSAPAVAMWSSFVDSACSRDSANYSATTSEIHRISSSCFCLQPALACQDGLSLPIRLLLISPQLETAKGGRGGKALRQRVGSTHRHWYSSSVFGSLLGPTIDFVRQRDQRVVDVIRNMCDSLKDSVGDIVSCSGGDAVHVRRGFACNNVIRGQVLQLPEARTCSRVDARYGKKSVVIGLGVCLYFVLHSLSTFDDNSSSVSMMAVPWLRSALQVLRMWGCSPSAGHHACCIEAERRTVERGLAAFEVAMEESRRQELTTKDAVVYQLACMRKAMWPRDRRLDADTQEELLQWIKSDAFTLDVPVKHVRRSYISDSFNRPLSAISCLPGAGPWHDDDDASWCDSESSAGSFSSVSSAASVASGGQLPFDMDMSLEE